MYLKLLMAVHGYPSNSLNPAGRENMTTNTSILHSLDTHYHITLHWGESCKELGPKGAYKVMQHIAEYNHSLRLHGIPEMHGRYLVTCRKSGYTEAKAIFAGPGQVHFPRTREDRYYIATISDMDNPERSTIFLSVLGLDAGGEVTFAAYQDVAHVVMNVLPPEAHERVRAGIDRIMAAWAPLTSAMAGGEKMVTTAIDFLRRPAAYDPDCPERKFWSHWSQREEGNLRKITVQHGTVSLGYVLVFWGKTNGGRTGHATYTHVNLPFPPTEPKDN